MARVGERPQFKFDPADILWYLVSDMNWIVAVAVLLGVGLIGFFGFAGFLFYWYVQGLKEAYNEGWEIPG